MFKKIQTLINSLAAHITVWPCLLGTAVMTTIAGWIAYVTDALKPYAPFSWVAVAYLGALIAVAIYALYQKARLWAVHRNISAEFHKNPDRINPLDNTFKEKRILISDLISPIEPIIRNKTFVDCEIIGPSNIFFRGTKPGLMSIDGAEWKDCNVAIVRDNAPLVAGIVVFEDCKIVRGKLFRIILLFTEQTYQETAVKMPEINQIRITR